MTPPRISIVIPFYNVQQYIAECLDSIYNQDIPEEEYEVICVNDASPDNSKDIVLEYQNKHHNLILVEHEVNMKLGAARNTGRHIARGKYIWNVDSDDKIVPNCLGRIIRILEKENLDVLMVDFIEFEKENVRSSKSFSLPESDDIISGLDYLKRHIHEKISTMVWTQIYSRLFLDNCNIFSPEINHGEDVPFVIESFLHARRMGFLAESCYIHRNAVESMTQEMRASLNPLKVYENSFVCGAYLDNVIHKIPKEEVTVREYVCEIEKYIILQHKRYLKGMPPKTKKHFQKLCRKDFFVNRYVFTYLGKKQILDYVRFIFQKVA